MDKILNVETESSGTFTLTKKILLIAILYFIPLLYVSYTMLTEHTEIQFSKSELEGNRYSRALRYLLEDISQSMLLSHIYLSEEADVKNQILALQDKIEIDFANLMDTDRELATELSTSEHAFNLRDKKYAGPSVLKKNWDVLKSELLVTTPETSQELHQRLINDIGTLQDQIGDTSQLILDPDLDTYYIMDSTLLKIPNVQMQVPALVIYLKKIIQNGSITNDDKANLIVQSTLLKNSITATREGIQKTYIFDRLSGDNQTQIALIELLKAYNEAGQNFLGYIQEKFINAEIPPDSSTEVNTFSNRMLSASYRFWDAAIIQFDRLLNKRMAYYRTQQLLIVILLVGVPIFILAYFSLRNIARPLKNLIAATRQLGSGDLSVRIPIKKGGPVGEIADSFNHMAYFLQQVIMQMKKSSILLTSSSTEIATAAKEQEATVTEQEATAKEISATARGIYESAKHLAETMDNVNKMAEETSSLANSGKEGLTKMSSIMQLMVEASNNIASKLGIISEKAANITGVITTITKVADQTNMLSLNAAIEAEKAGEHGHSFAVIAREIRRLADQTALATLDIEKMVNEMTAAVSSGVMGVDKFSGEIRIGVNQVKTVGEQLSTIINQVEEQTSGIESVNEGMQRQTEAAQQITEAISQLSEATQQTASSTRRFHGTIKQMNLSTKELQLAVEAITH